MTDDEAFIRAIVDAPGDDAPRLIYADWLDERGDPRGEYLRVELEWAVPWRERDRPKYSVHLLDLAIPLDPIWVARVTRPPMGVCLDRFEIRDSGPHLTLDDMQSFERRQSISLPEPLVAFLLNQNGGTLNRPLEIGLRKEFGSFRMLQPMKLQGNADNSIPLPLSSIQSLADPNWGKVIEIADDHADGSYFIGVISGVRGIIFYLRNRDTGTNSSRFGPDRVAASLSEMFAYLC